jgi:hypothetical protein
MFHRAVTCVLHFVSLDHLARAGISEDGLRRLKSNVGSVSELCALANEKSRMTQLGAKA